MFLHSPMLWAIRDLRQGDHLRGKQRSLRKGRKAGAGKGHQTRRIQAMLRRAGC